MVSDVLLPLLIYHLEPFLLLTIPIRSRGGAADANHWDKWNLKSISILL